MKWTRALARFPFCATTRCSQNSEFAGLCRFVGRAQGCWQLPIESTSECRAAKISSPRHRQIRNSIAPRFAVIFNVDRDSAKGTFIRIPPPRSPAICYEGRYQTMSKAFEFTLLPALVVVSEFYEPSRAFEMAFRVPSVLKDSERAKCSVCREIHAFAAHNSLLDRRRRAYRGGKRPSTSRATGSERSAASTAAAGSTACTAISNRERAEFRRSC